MDGLAVGVLTINISHGNSAAAALQLSFLDSFPIAPQQPYNSDPANDEQ